MTYHLRIARVSAGVKVGRVEIGIQQGRCLEQTARADIVLAVIDERSKWLMASGAAQGRVVREGLVKKCLAMFFRFTHRSCDLADRTKPAIGHKIDVFYIRDD